MWLAVQPSGDTDYYAFKKVARIPSRADQWEARLELGNENDQNKLFKVFAFPLGEEATRLLDHLGVGPDPQRSFAYLGELPMQGGVVASESFQRDDRDTEPC